MHLKAIINMSFSTQFINFTSKPSDIVSDRSFIQQLHWCSMNTVHMLSALFANFIHKFAFDLLDFLLPVFIDFVKDRNVSRPIFIRSMLPLSIRCNGVVALIGKLIVIKTIHDAIIQTGLTSSVIMLMFFLRFSLRLWWFGFFVNSGTFRRC